MSDGAAVSAAAEPSGIRRTRSRDAVLRAIVELIEEVGTEEVSYKLIARRAGVGERTVFRHFATRAELLFAAADWIERTVFEPTEFASIFDFPLVIRESMGSYDQRPQLAHVVAESNVSWVRSEPNRRVVRLQRAIESELPGVDPVMGRRVVATLSHLGSASAWVVMHRELRMSSRDIADAAAWAGELVLGPFRHSPERVS